MCNSCYSGPLLALLLVLNCCVIAGFEDFGIWVLDYHIKKSVISVQCHFIDGFIEDPPSYYSIHKLQ